MDGWHTKSVCVPFIACLSDRVWCTQTQIACVYVQEQAGPEGFCRNTNASMKTYRPFVARYTVAHYTVNKYTAMQASQGANTQCVIISPGNGLCYSVCIALASHEHAHVPRRSQQD